MMTRSFSIFLGIATFVALLFIFFPQVDLYVSGLFYDPAANKFFLNQHPIAIFIHDSVHAVAKTVGVGILALLIFNWIKKTNFKDITNRKLIYMLLVLAIGPGLIVNAVFKENWGRARPYQTENFGGTKTYTPAFVLSDQCEKNCSFTSGDPSVGFFFFSWMFIATKRKKECLALALGLGGLYGMNRIVQGAHFFSDVIFSGVFVYITAYALYHLMFKNKELAS